MSRSLSTTLILASLILATSIQSVGASDTIHPWTSFHHDGTHTGVTDSPPAAVSETLWDFFAGGSVYSSPAVASGLVYFGSVNGSIFAVNESNGALVWSYPTGGEVRSSAAVSADNVYIGSGDGNLYALDAHTGTMKWKFTTAGPIFSSPTLVEDVVYFGSQDGKLYAVDAVAGGSVWSFATGERIYYSSPAVAEGLVFIGSDDNAVHAVSVANGQQVWSVTTSDDVWSSPAVSSGNVFVGSADKSISAIRASDGQVIWRVDSEDYVISSPAVTGGRVYIGSHDHELYCLDETTGQVIWTAQTGMAIWSSPAVADGVVYVGSFDRSLYAFNAVDGSQLGKFETGGDIFSSPAVADGTIFVGSHDGHVYAIGWDFQVAVSPLMRSVVQGSSTTFEVTAGSLSAFDLPIVLSLAIPTVGDNLITGFNPPQIQPSRLGSVKSNLTLMTAFSEGNESMTTPGGTYTMRLRASASNRPERTRHSVDIILKIPDFTVNIFPSNSTIRPDGSASFQVIAESLGGFNSWVMLSLSGLPSEAGSFTFNPRNATISPGAPMQSTLTLNLNSGFADKSYQMSVEAFSSALGINQRHLKTVFLNPPAVPALASWQIMSIAAVLVIFPVFRRQARRISDYAAHR